MSLSRPPPTVESMTWWSRARASGELTAMTAQHAVRQGKLAAHNIVASLGRGQRRAYRHRDLGFVIDLGGFKAAANPLGVPLSGLSAKAVTRSYHLLSLPSNRIRVANDWLLDAVLRRQAVQFGLIRADAVPLTTTSTTPLQTLSGSAGRSQNM
jgi:NADH:ubiquinone reductase (H+-translocating)